MDELVKLKTDQTQDRWQTAIKDKAFDSIRHLPILETRPEHFLSVLEAGKVSTNVYLWRIHNFALDMTWLPWPVPQHKQRGRLHRGFIGEMTANPDGDAERTPVHNVILGRMSGSFAAEGND
jgi:hypothetical protein